MKKYQYVIVDCKTIVVHSSVHIIQNNNLHVNFVNKAQQSVKRKI